MVEALVYAYFYLVLYSFLGWICESTYVSIPKGHFVNRGFFYGPYIPIYGFGSLIALYPLLPFQNNPLIIFFLGSLLCSVMEYITSWVMEKLFHMRWWDYSYRKYNINGRVCLLNSTLFGLMLLALVYIVHPFAKHLVTSIPFVYIVCFLGVFTIGWSIDFVFTLISLMRRKHVLEKMRADVEEFQAQFEANVQMGLSEIEQRKEERQARKEKRREEFELWVAQQENLQSRLNRFHENMENIVAMKKSHLSSAFPERHVSEEFKELKRIADEMHEKFK